MMARLSWYLDPLSAHQLKMFIKQEVKFGPPMTKRSGSAQVKDWAILEPYVQTDESPLELTHNAKFVTEPSDLMVDSRSKSYGLEPHLQHSAAAVCVLEQDTLISSKYCFNPGRPT